jgi:hypothetical protein
LSIFIITERFSSMVGCLSPPLRIPKISLHRHGTHPFCSHEMYPSKKTAGYLLPLLISLFLSSLVFGAAHAPSSPLLRQGLKPTRHHPTSLVEQTSSNLLNHITSNQNFPLFWVASPSSRNLETPPLW